MKIGIVGNFDKEIKPNSQGGTEIFTYELSDQLAKSPDIESITVFGVGKNYFNNPKITFVPVLPEERVEFTQDNKFLANLSRERPDFDAELRFGIANKIVPILLSSDFDLVHDNSTSLVFTSLSNLFPMPILTTLHTNVLSPSVIIPYSLGLLDPKSKKQFFAAIAKHQEKFAKDNNINIDIIQTIYNGLDISYYSSNTQTLNNSYGLWLGRVKRKHDKGLKEAVMTAERAESNLRIVAKIDDQEFFDTEIKPNMGKYCTIVPNPQTLSEKNDLYGQASYFIYPVQWEEPFGLVFVEAMACGTPVIAFAKGAVPEVILDGKTGFVVNPSDDDIRGDWIIKKTGIEGLREAIEKIHSMPENEYLQMRKNCREHVEKNFTIKRMAEEYENVYKKILSRSSR